MLLYKLWQVIQDDEAETTPGQAVGLLFVPIYNLIWQFTAYRGLAEGLNRYAVNRNIRVPEAPETLALVGCILSCCGIIPLIGVLFWIFESVILYVALKQMSNTAIAILQSPGRQ